MKRTLSALLICLMLFVCLPVFAVTGNRDGGVALYGFTNIKLTSGSSYISDTRQFVGFNSDAPALTQSFASINDRVSYAADTTGDVIYAFAHEYSDTDITADSFYSINPSTWAATMLGTLDMNYQVMDMTYSLDGGIMYAMVFVVDEAHYHIMSVSLSDGQLTDVVDLTAIGVSITECFAYIGDGRFYSVGRHGGEGLIFDANGIISRIGVPINENVENITAMTYYAPENRIYAVKHRTIPAGSFGMLMAIDLSTGDSDELGVVGGGYGYSMTSLFALPTHPIALPSLPTQQEFDNAINASGSALTFINDPNHAWTIETASPRTYVTSSNAGIDNSSATITAVFNGLTAGQTLSFDWRVSSESNYDFLTFYSNGETVDRISGSVSWTAKSYTIPANGDYTFEWVYSKDQSVASGTDCGSIDNVSITGNQPQPYDPELLTMALNNALNVQGGTLVFNNDLTHPWAIEDGEDGRACVRSTITAACDTQTIYLALSNVSAGDAIRFDWKASCEQQDRLLFYSNRAIVGAISGDADWSQYTYIAPEDGQYIFSWQYAKDVEDDGVLYDNAVWFDNVEYISNYEPDEPVYPDMPDEDDFDAAVNGAGQSLHYTNDNANPWQIANDGERVCAVSDIAGRHDTETEFWVDIGYAGEGTTISFDWKTSCEEYADRVCLTLNGASYIVASGDTDWTTVTYTIETANNYVVGFRYEKNDWGEAGGDCAWIDNIVIVKANTDGSHTVTFVDWDGTVLSEQSVESGQGAIAPEDPARDGYVFIGWDTPFDNVTSDLTVTAMYRMLGDVNGDDRLSSADALIITRASLGLIVIDNIQTLAADINQDGEVSSTDALYVLRLSLIGQSR